MGRQAVPSLSTMGKRFQALVVLATGTTIRSLRRRLGLSLESFARKLRIPIDDAKAIEEGTHPIPLTLLDRIAHTLKVSMSFIVTSAERRASQMMRKVVASKRRKRGQLHK
jgi:transcriptional regulator with XRE-family HTH domain